MNRPIFGARTEKLKHAFKQFTVNKFLITFPGVHLYYRSIFFCRHHRVRKKSRVEKFVQQTSPADQY